MAGAKGPRRTATARARRHPDYLQKVLTARVYDVAVETQLELAPHLSARLGNDVWLKREDNQPVFSFKLRGAYNKMAHLALRSCSARVICASAGNHAQGVALAARRLGCKAVIVMPVTTPQLKIDAVRALGGEVVLHGDSYSDAYAHALELERARGLTFVHPFDDPDVIAGQGTVGMEILRQQQGPIDAVFVAIGGGGLISGIAAYVKAVRPEIRIIGVQTTDSDAMVRSVRAGKRVPLGEVGLFSDGTAVKLVGEETFRLTRQLVDDFIVVDTDEVCAAIKDVFEDTPQHPRAGRRARRGGDQAARRSDQGQGQDLRRHHLRREHELRPAAFRRRASRGRRAARSPVRRHDSRATRLVQALLRAARRRRSVTEFNYRISDPQIAHVFVGLTIAGRDEAPRIARNFERHGFATVDLGDDELAKQHVRHMVGGRSELAKDEQLFRFVFPERPGALMKFLSSMHPELEHQPVPLPQPGRRLRPHPGRHPGAQGRPARAARIPRHAALSVG